MNTLQDIVVRELTDEVKISNLERERETIMQNKDFQKWLKEMHIGSRIEVKDSNAKDMMQDYNYTKWIQRESTLRNWMPEFILRMF